MIGIIIDDNKIARVTIKQLSTQVPDLEIAGEPLGVRARRAGGHHHGLAQCPAAGFCAHHRAH